MSVSESLMRCWNLKNDVKTGGYSHTRMSPEEDLLTVWTASGIKMTWTWFRLLCGTWVALRSCKGDGGRPSEAALQEEASNHLKLLWSKAMVVSVEEKSHKMRQVWIKKVSIKRTNVSVETTLMVSELGTPTFPKISVGGTWSTAYATPGV